MIDESDLLDPGKNFTEPESQPFGARIPEFVLCQLIGFALKSLRTQIDAPNNLVDELFRNFGRDEIGRIKKWLREHTNVPVQVNWPREGIALPHICVVNGGEQEASEFSFMGDRTGLMRRGVLGDGRASVREQLGVGLNVSLQVYVATQDPDLTMYLHHLVRFIIMSNKDKLAEMYDLHNIVISGRDLQHDASMFPSFAYLKMLQIDLLTMFDFNTSEEAAKIVSLDLMVAGHDTNGVEVLTEVPSIDDTDV